jgi:hypothetical protein
MAVKIELPEDIVCPYFAPLVDIDLFPRHARNRPPCNQKGHPQRSIDSKACFGRSPHFCLRCCSWAMIVIADTSPLRPLKAMLINLD